MKLKCPNLSLSEFLTCRRILFGMVLVGLAVNNILITSFNIAIIAMGADLALNEREKHDVLGIIFWGQCLLYIPSGRLSELIGPRKVMGFSILMGSLLLILTPTIAYWNYYVLLVSRVAMGTLTGASWPSLLPLTVKWIPPNQQSKFMLCIEGASIGTILTYFYGGIIISECGWITCFYIFGSLGVLWSMGWFYLVYDSPQQHPRISENEKEEIEKQIFVNGVEIKKTKSIPWKKILMSGPVWAIVAAQVTAYYTYMTLSIEMPSYMDQIFQLDLKSIGLYSSLPYGCKIFTGIIFAFVADSLIRTKYISTTSTRKIFGAIALFFPAILMLEGAASGRNFAISLMIFICTLCLNAATNSIDVNILDIAPNFSGTIGGLTFTFSSIGVYISTKIVAMFLEKGQTFYQWSQMFWVLFYVNMAGFIIYTWLCSGKLQSWNQIED